MTELAALPLGIADGKLPDGWRMATIDELLKVRNGYAFKSKDYSQSGTLLVRQSNLGGDTVSLDKTKFLPKSYLDEYSEFQVRKGDILIGMSGSIGKLCTYDRDEPALQNQRTGLLVFKDEQQKSWVWHYLPLLERGLRAVGKGVAVQNVSAKQIESFPIPVAPLDQQRGIVAEIEKQFSRLDEAVASLKRVKANLKRYKAAVLKAAVEGNLTEEWRKAHTDVEPAIKLVKHILETRRSQWRGKGKYKEPIAHDTTDLRELPKGWIWTTLDQLTSKITSGSRDWSPFYGKGTSIFVLAQNVRPMAPDFSVQQMVDPPKDDPSCERSRIHDGDLLATIVGANTGQVCMVSKVPSDAYVCQSVALMRPTMFATAVYMNYWLNSDEHGQRYFKRCIYGQGRPHLSFEQLMATPIALPPLAEQDRIVAEVDRHFSLVREAEAQVDANLKRADCLRQSILASAFTGSLTSVYEDAAKDAEVCA